MNTPANTDSANDPQAEQARRRRRKIGGGVFFAALALVGVSLVLYAWRLPPFNSHVQHTEDAMVRGQVTLIAPQVNGYVTQVPVQDFQSVRKGQLLVKIDDRIYAQQLQQAEARLQAARAALANADQQQRGADAHIAEARAQVQSGVAERERSTAALQRANELAGKQLISQQDRETALAGARRAAAGVSQAQAGLMAANEAERSVEVGKQSLAANVSAAEAAVELAKINLDNTRIVAPRDGRLGQVAVRVGAYVGPGTQLMGLVPDTLWVIANFKETQLADIRVSQAATFTVDALKRAKLHGHVQRIAPATGSEFSVLAPDNATGNFVKIAQRIPVRISIDPNQPLEQRLSPGMSVEVSIDTAQNAAQ